MKNRPRSPIEIGKNVLIIFLSCSALFLIGKSTLFFGMPKQVDSGNSDSSSGMFALSDIVIRPNQLVIQSGHERFGLQYDQDVINLLYDSSLNLHLREVVGSVTQVHAIAEETWQEGLSAEGTWAYFSFPGVIPLAELSAWLGEGRENPNLSGSVHALLLQQEGRQLTLRYRDESSGLFYEADPITSRESDLDALFVTFERNDVLFAFESDDSHKILDPYTIFVPSTSTYPDYTGENPLEGITGDELERLLADLSFNPKASSYQTAEATVISQGRESLRVRNDGVISYETTEETGKYILSDESLRSKAEYAKNILDILCRNRIGVGTTYLAAITTLEDGSVSVCFGYLLDGVPVQLGETGYCAEFIFSNSALERFEITLRRYTHTETTSSLLPAEQAIAIFTDLNQKERELVVGYLDSTTNRSLHASWIAI